MNSGYPFRECLTWKRGRPLLRCFCTSRLLGCAQLVSRFTTPQKKRARLQRIIHGPIDVN